MDVRYHKRVGELYRLFKERWGVTQDLAVSDYGRWWRLDGQAMRTARELAFHEVVEAS